MTLRSTWWSRPHEYAWAAQFAGPNLVVLDAACGISHPFKWFLGETSRETWACDLDSRIANQTELLRVTYDDLGEEAYQVVKMKGQLLKQVNLVHASICDLPDNMPQFDRIFCISTLEHLDPISREQALEQFARNLAPNGLVVLTVDYPKVIPEDLLESASEAGLVPAKKAHLGTPPEGALSNGYLFIYRCVLKHRSE